MVQEIMYLSKDLICLLLLTTFSFVKSLCPVGTIESRDPSKCYKLFAQPKDFAFSSTNCESLDNGFLAAPVNSFENAFIDEILLASMADSSTLIWIGITKTETSWTWPNGSTITYSNWQKGEPSINGSCVAIQISDGKWFAKDCSTQFPSICQFPSITDSYSCTTPKPQIVFPCDLGWTYFNHSCYKVFRSKNWTDAENFCVQQSIPGHQAHLASIHSLEENEFIFELTTTGVNWTAGVPGWMEQVWIGLNDRDTVGVYTWTDGTPYDYEYWQMKEPDDPTHQNCILFYADIVDGDVDGYQRWADWVCSIVLRAFICKKTAYA